MIFLGLMGFLEFFGSSFGMFPFSIFPVYFWTALPYSFCG